MAVSTVELISSLCRGAWDDARGKAYALTLLSADVPIERIAQTARWLLTQVDPDDISPAKLISEAKRYVPPAARQLTSDVVSEIRRGYGQPTSRQEHPGEGVGGNRPSVVMPDPWHRRRLDAQYLRMASETATVNARVAARERDRRSGGRGYPQAVGEMLTTALSGLMATWLKRDRSCEWCHIGLTGENLKPYLEWCRNLGEIRPLGTPMPEPRVFCCDCAPGAISELVDGIAYVVGNTRQQESDPWTRQARA